jgi:hypothetical protein
MPLMIFTDIAGPGKHKGEGMLEIERWLCSDDPRICRRGGEKNQSYTWTYLLHAGTGSETPRDYDLPDESPSTPPRRNISCTLLGILLARAGKCSPLSILLPVCVRERDVRWWGERWYCRGGDWRCQTRTEAPDGCSCLVTKHADPEDTVFTAQAAQLLPPLGRKKIPLQQNIVSADA